MKDFDSEIVSGSILRSVWKLTWPVTLLNLINGFHSIIDQSLVGHFVPSANNAANAAIGAAWQVFLVIVVFLASLFHGMNVMIARYAGRKDRDNMNLVFYQVLLSSLYLLLFVVAPLGYALAPWLLDSVLNLAPEVQQHALPYLRLMFACSAPMFLMFLVVGAFQAAGDPKTPLVLGVFATILHILISVVLIAGIGPFPQMGVIGAALGSVIAPGVSVVIALSLVASGRALLKPPPSFTLIPRLDLLKIVARIGLPTGIQGVLLNLGGVALIYFINRLPTDVSPAALAAYTICYNQIFSLITWTSFGLRSAASTVMGQNIGAGNPQRGKKAVRMAANLGFLWALVIGSLFWAIPEQLLAIFDATSEPLLTYATSLLHYLLWSGLVLAPALALTGGIQGAGATMIPMFIAFATQIVLLLGLCLYYDLAGLLTPARIWMAILICHIVRLLLTYAVFQTEGWIHTKVELHDPAPEEEPVL